MSDLPRIVTTDELREPQGRLPALAAEVAEQLHPHGRHIVFDLFAFGDVTTGENVTPCTVLAVTRRGEVVRIAHYFDDSRLDALPTVETLIVGYAELATAHAEHAVIAELEAWLHEAEGVQQTLPFADEA